MLQHNAGLRISCVMLKHNLPGLFSPGVLAGRGTAWTRRLLILRIVMQCRLAAAGTAACGGTRADVPSAAKRVL